MSATAFRLNHLGCLKISGQDAESFLQGQMTMDLRHLPPEQLGFTSFLSAKGRVIANARLMKCDEAVWLVLPASMTQILLQRLKMFVLRSKVVIEDLSESIAVIGLTDPALALLSDHPASLDDAWPYASWRWISLIACGEISNMMADPDAERSWQQRDIESGLAWILPPSREAHIPQMINLDLHQGIGFEKGCYTGQEIVARTHYLGQLKRRLFRIECTSDEVPIPGTAIYLGEEAADESVGEWVNAVPINDGIIEGLAVLKIDQADAPLQSGDMRSTTRTVHAFHAAGEPA